MFCLKNNFSHASRLIYFPTMPVNHWFKSNWNTLFCCRRWWQNGWVTWWLSTHTRWEVASAFEMVSSCVCTL